MILPLALLPIVFSLVLCEAAKLAPIMEPVKGKLNKDNYIVILRSNLPDSTFLAHELWLNMRVFTRLAESKGRPSEEPLVIRHKYDKNVAGFHGYGATFKDRRLLEEVRGRPEVAFVEPDQEMHILHDEEHHVHGSSFHEPLYKERYSSFIPRRMGSIRVIKGIEEELKMSYIPVSGVREPSHFKPSRLFDQGSLLVHTQSNAPWGLGRIASRNKLIYSEKRFHKLEYLKAFNDDNPPPVDEPMPPMPPFPRPHPKPPINRPPPPPMTFSYRYPKTAGRGVTVYIIDTGININHPEFQGRAKWGVTIPENELDTDMNGHGTHCAGIVGSVKYGVAKESTLVAVKVLGSSGFGSNMDVIKGVEWVIKKHQALSKQAHILGQPSPKSVINMSLGGGRSIALESVINQAITLGIHVAVAAGNEYDNACDYSPAASELAITVGASTVVDSMAFFSNWGKCVDVIAPGLDITSTWIQEAPEDEFGYDDKNLTHRVVLPPPGNSQPDPSPVKTISGTSMASPHVAGILALYLGERHYTPRQLKSVFLKHTTSGQLTDLPKGTPNKLANISKLLIKHP